MISAGYKNAYQQGYSDAMRDFRKEPKTGHCKDCKWYDEDGIYNPNCENCCRNYKDNYCGARMNGKEKEQ